MRWKWGAAAGVLCSCSAMAIPVCEAPVFFCEMQQARKAVSLCEAGGKLQYAYGPLQSTPELLLQVPPWNGIGHDYWASITIPNGQWAYRLGLSVPRGPDSTGGYAGVTVVRSGKDVRTLACKIETLQERVESLEP